MIYELLNPLHGLESELNIYYSIVIYIESLHHTIYFGYFGFYIHVRIWKHSNAKDSI